MMILIHPRSCRHCGRLRRDHLVKKFTEPVGWHNFTEPTPGQVKLRTSAIRIAREGR
jgi:hypothetical protein